MSSCSAEEMLKKPWRYLGYRSFSRFLASDNDFLIFRRFGVVHVRVLLSLQDEMVQLESQLEDCDMDAIAQDAQEVHNGSFREDDTERKKVLKSLLDKLLQYGQCRVELWAKSMAKSSQTSFYYTIQGSAHLLLLALEMSRRFRIGWEISTTQSAGRKQRTLVRATSYPSFPKPGQYCDVSSSAPNISATSDCGKYIQRSGTKE